MREDRKLTFLESIAVSAATGAVSGGICGFAKTSDNLREAFTEMMIDISLDTAQKVKQRDREGYINPGW